MQKAVFEISWVSLWRVLFFIALAVLMYFSLDILLGLFLAIVISSGLEFIVNYLERKGVPRTLGVILIFLASALLVIITVYTILPLLIIDLNTALIAFNKLANKSWWGSFLDFRSTQSINQIISQISGEIFSGGASPFNAVSSIFGNVALAISVIISSFYLSLTRDGVERFIRAVLPADYEQGALEIYARARHRIGLWFRTQILLSLIVGILVLISLLLLGVKHAVLLALIAGIFEIVPFIGPVLAGSAAIISAFIASPTLALYVLITFLAIHQIESHFLIPLLIGRNVGLHPVIVIISLLIGIETGGLLGALISVPAAVVVQEVIEDWAGKSQRFEDA